MRSAFLFGLCVALYAGYLASPTVFDDLAFVSGAYDYALQSDFQHTRVLPYFSLGFVHVMSDGQLAWNRALNTALLCLVILSIYFFLSRQMFRSGKEANICSHAVWISCLWIALNPLTVYATGYLIQRTIVLATLFGIISATLYLRAQQEERNVDLVSATLLAFLSVMSKEHAVLFPLATIALTPLVTDWSRRSVARAVAYFLMTLPGALWAILHRGQELMGRSYEEFSGDVLAQFVRPEHFDSPLGLWLMSVGTQLVLFWKYLFLWFMPNPGWMSADMRVDFDALWSGGTGYLGAALSLVVLVGAAVCWWRTRGKGRVGVVSSVLLFAAIPFAVELSVVRVQEPFVLYRSFLWMPAYALLLYFLLTWGHEWVSRRGVIAVRVFWGAALLGCLTLFPLAQDRLRSFSSEEALWRDALAKLPRPDVPGADRIYYNLAGEAFKRKDFRAALDWSDKVVAQNPQAFQGYLARGTSLLALREFDAAEGAFGEASAHHPPQHFLGYIEFKHCLVSEARAQRDDAIACLRRSAKMGYEPARFRLQLSGVPVEG